VRVSAFAAFRVGGVQQVSRRRMHVGLKQNAMFVRRCRLEYSNREGVITSTCRLECLHSRRLRVCSQH
jgi:hypothetical protein